MSLHSSKAICKSEIFRILSKNINSSPTNLPTMKFKFLSLVLLVGLVFASCSKKDDYDKDKEYDKKECIYLLFPQTWVLSDGYAITLADKEDSALKDWYIANPNSEEKPELAYPVDIKNQKAEVQTVNNEVEMMTAKKGCEDYYEKECIYILFPQTWTLPDASEVTLADKEDVTLKDWYIANPESEEKPELAYPVDVKNKAGEVLTINNKEEMIAAKKNC